MAEHFRRVDATELLAKIVEFDWYADSVNGDDNATGKSSAQTLKTIAALLSKPITAGQRIGLRRGSTWREELVIPANNVEVYAYGSGAKPLFDCSDVIAAGGWSKTGGQTFVYQVTLSPDLAATCWNSVWENNVRLVRATSVANCDATAGSYYPSSDVTPPITMYVHASDNSNPGTNGKTYEYAKRQQGINAYNYTYPVIDGVWTRRNLNLGGSIRLGKYGSLYNSLCEDGNAHNLIVATGTYCYNVEARNCYYSVSSKAMFVFNEDTPNNEGVTFENCKATNDILVAGAEGWYGHANVSGSFGVVKFINCTVERCTSPLSAVSFTQMILSGLTITGCTFGLNANYAGATYTVTNLTIVHTGNNALLVQADATMTVNGAVITMPTCPNQAIFISAPGSLTLNNVRITCPDGVGYPILVQDTAGATGGLINFQNCTFDGFRGDFYYLPTAIIVLSDGNRFISPTSYQWVLGGTTYTSFALWQAAGYDLHSRTG